jgi:ribonuclease D
MAEISEKLQIPLENILTPDYLRQLCFEPPQEITEDSVADFLTRLGARQWQVEQVSGLLAKALLSKPEIA